MGPAPCTSGNGPSCRREPHPPERCRWQADRSKRGFRKTPCRLRAEKRVAIQGISTRIVDDLVKAMGMSGFFKSQVNYDRIRDARYDWIKKALPLETLHESAEINKQYAEIQTKKVLYCPMLHHAMVFERRMSGLA
jgi:hypothetical protein